MGSKCWECVESVLGVCLVCWVCCVRVGSVFRVCSECVRCVFIMLGMCLGEVRVYNILEPLSMPEWDTQYKVYTFSQL